MCVLGCCCCVLCGPPPGSAGTPWEPGWLAGSGALGSRGNSRAEPGNTSSGRKAAAARREPRAGLAEQAPDTLSVQPSGALAPGSTPRLQTWAGAAAGLAVFAQTAAPRGGGCGGLCRPSCAPSGPWRHRGGAHGVPCTQRPPGQPCSGPAQPHTLLPGAGDGPWLSVAEVVGGSTAPGGHQAPGPATVVTSGFDGPARWGCRGGLCPLGPATPSRSGTGVTHPPPVCLCLPSTCPAPGPVLGVRPGSKQVRLKSPRGSFGPGGLTFAGSTNEADRGSPAAVLLLRARQRPGHRARVGWPCLLGGDS